MKPLLPPPRSGWRGRSFQFRPSGADGGVAWAEPGGVGAGVFAVARRFDMFDSIGPVGSAGRRYRFDRFGFCVRLDRRSVLPPVVHMLALGVVAVRGCAFLFVDVNGCSLLFMLLVVVRRCSMLVCCCLVSFVVFRCCSPLLSVVVNGCLGVFHCV